MSIINPYSNIMRKLVESEGEKPVKVFWFSRHEMTPEQKEAIGSNIEIIQCNKTIKSAYEVESECKDCDIIAIVAPINLQQQFLKIANGRPVIMAKNNRVILDDGEKVQFNFDKWEQLEKIEIVVKDFSPIN